MTKPTVLLTGAYPAWDLEDLEARYKVLRLWEAADADALLAEHGPEVRAIATGFAGILNREPALAAKATHTGNPVRPAVIAACEDGLSERRSR